MKTQSTKEPLPVRIEDPNTPAQTRRKLMELLLAQQRQTPKPTQQERL